MFEKESGLLSYYFLIDRSQSLRVLEELWFLSCHFLRISVFDVTTVSQDVIVSHFSMQDTR